MLRFAFFSATSQGISPQTGLQTHRPPALTPWVLLAKGPRLLPVTALSHMPGNWQLVCLSPLPCLPSATQVGGLAPWPRSPGALPMLTGLLQVCSCPRTSSASKLTDQQAQARKVQWGRGPCLGREGAARGAGALKWLWWAPLGRLCVDVCGVTVFRME